MEKSGLSRLTHYQEVTCSNHVAATLSYWINSERKKEMTIIKISKNEAQYLIDNGIGYGEGGLKSTSGHYRSFYVTESRKCLYLLKEYRKENYHK